MKQFIFIFLTVFLSYTGLSQIKYTLVQGDSVKLANANDSANAELIIENSTRNVPGYLFNTGNGRTQFRRALIPIGPNKYLIGNDTLDLSGIVSTNAWLTSGNAGTDSANFIGTIDNQPIRFRVDNQPSGFMEYLGNYNQGLGINSLLNISTGTKNTAFGYASLFNNLTGSQNVGIGYTSLYHVSSGNYNTGVGWAALGYNDGSGNTAMGTGALNSDNGVVFSGNYNTAIGYSALLDNYSNNYNIGLGASAGRGRSEKNTFYISDSTSHMYYKLDSSIGIAPSVIGKDSNGFWHVYSTPSGGGSYTLPIATTAVLGGVEVGSGLIIDSSGKLSTSTSLLKPGSVPYAGPAGTLIQDTTGLVYDGNNLQVGHSGFYNTVGLSLNGGRGQLTASGFGLTIGTSGGQPMDASKSITFYNSSTPYAQWSMGSVSDSMLYFKSYMTIYPGTNLKYDLGKPTNKWRDIYAGNGRFDSLFINGNYFDPTSVGGYILPIASAATLGGIRVGSGLSIDGNGVLSSAGSYNLPYNGDSTTYLGGDTAYHHLPFQVLTTKDSSGEATLVGGVLNIPNYAKSAPTLDKVTAAGDSSSRDVIINGIEAGTGAGNISTNTLFGSLALQNNTTGWSNTAIGTKTLTYNTTGFFNTAVGRLSLSSNTIGSNNIAVGKQTLNQNISGNYNTAMGVVSLDFNKIGNHNTAIGYGSGTFNEADNNTFIGSRADTVFYLDVSKTKYFNNSDVTDSTITIPNHGFGASGTYCLLHFVQGTGTVNGLSGQGSYYIFPAYIIDANTISISGVTAGGTGTGNSLTPQFQYSNITLLGANTEPTQSNQVVLGDKNVTQVLTYGQLFLPAYGHGALTGAPTYNLGTDASGNIIETSLSGGGGSYTLPIASAASLGGIKVGSGLSIDGNGLLSTTGSSHLPYNGDSTTYLGGDTLYHTLQNYWKTTGNMGTSSSNFIGTFDNNSLNFKVNDSTAGFIGTTSTYNTFLGILTSHATASGIKNTAIGGTALKNLTTGTGNTMIGYAAGFNFTTGIENTVAGWSTSSYNQTGVGNTIFGAEAFSAPTHSIANGSYNTALGFQALTANYSHNYNIGIGVNAGSNKSDSSTLYISDSTKHMYYKLDTIAGLAPSVIGKDSNGFWHVYATPSGGGSTPSLQQVTDVGNITTHSILLSGTGYPASGTNAFIQFSNTSNITNPSYLLYEAPDASLNIAASNTGLIAYSISSGRNYFYNQLGLVSYGLGTYTGTPTYNLSVDASGNVIETALSQASGTATLSSGTVTVNTTLIKAGAKIFVSVNTPGGTQGFLSAPTGSIIDGTSFVINSSSANDISTVNWQIINP